MTGINHIDINPDMGIPLADGIRLSARVWMPVTAVENPLPAILEYLPYRKSDFTAARDHPMHRHFAEHGYISIRVDRRGCGDSEGIFDDEYSEQELSDGVEIINWIAAQPWCDGNVGIQGISWGGFNGLQLAARAPEPLKAVITIGTTVDRFSDDIHFKGGVQLCENIGWAANMMPRLALPPDPAIVGENWRGMWMERLAHTAFMAPDWLGHKDRDDYWKHGSICEDYTALKAPVLGIGGMHDGYRNAPAHLAENLRVPVKAIAGPWSHKYPHISTIGPSIDYLNEALRWWDRWLKGVESGVENDPAYRAYVMDSVKADPSLDHRPGRWVGESEWPSPHISDQELPLGDGTLGKDGPFSISVQTDMACGRSSGEYFPFGFGPGELPDEQAHDDALSACFDSGPLNEDWDILGAPRIDLKVAADAPQAQMIIRLCDLRPDGGSTLISLGVLNLRHRDGFDHANDLIPGKTYDVSIALDQSAYRLPKGHRLRIAISPSYWPYLWPEGHTYALTISGGTLFVPRRANWSGPDVHFDPPVQLPQRNYSELRAGAEAKSWTEDPESGNITLEIEGDSGSQEDQETGLISESRMRERWEIKRDEPASAHVEINWEKKLARENWSVRIEASARMWGKEKSFDFEQTLRAWEGGQKVFEKRFEGSVPRYD